MCGSRKYPYPHHGGNWKFWRGGGGIFLLKNGNSGEVGGCLTEIPSVVGVWIFSGTTQFNKREKMIDHHTHLRENDNIYLSGEP